MDVMHADPLPVDAVRDFWDWVGLWAGLGTGAVGIVLALLAQRTANKARLEAAEAERRAVERAVHERRLVFELEVLRDLAEAIGGQAADRLAEFPLLPADDGRLSLLPPEALPVLRSLPTLTDEELRELVGFSANYDTELREVAELDEDVWISPIHFARNELREVLLREIASEIETRMHQPR